MVASASPLPRLRPIEIRSTEQRGRPVFMLRDPLHLTDTYLLIPRVLGPVLMLCDGTRNTDAICTALADEYGLPLERDVVDQVIGALDEGLLLDNARFAQALDEARMQYRAAPFRPMALADQAYPADPDALRRMLQGYLNDVDDTPPPLASGPGLFSPHIDYARGGPVYAAVWKQAAQLARDAELVVLLATDHASGESNITLTRQHYATPFGVLPTAVDVVDALAKTLGEQVAFADELHHRGEHSIELVAVWLHYMRGERPCALVPILCGSLSRFVQGAGDLENDPMLKAVLDTLRQATRGRRTLVVASGDMSHVGPAFGGQAMYKYGWEQTRIADEELIRHLCAGDSNGFFSAIKRVGDRNNVCGVSPFYLALQLMGEPCGHLAAYDRCPADDKDTSLVSVCGIAFGEK